jgi:hypothetical protein
MYYGVIFSPTFVRLMASKFLATLLWLLQLTKRGWESNNTPLAKAKVKK